MPGNLFKTKCHPFGKWLNTISGLNMQSSLNQRFSGNLMKRFESLKLNLALTLTQCAKCPGAIGGGGPLRGPAVSCGCLPDSMCNRGSIQQFMGNNKAIHTRLLSLPDICIQMYSMHIFYLTVRISTAFPVRP